MDIRPMINTCTKQIQQFCKHIDALDLCIQEEKKQITWQITTLLSRLDIVYLKTASILHAPSTLYARVFLYKNDSFSLLPLEMQQIWNIPGCGTSIYPYIESPQRMDACICDLLSGLEALLLRMDMWAQTENRYASAREAKLQEVFRVCAVHPEDLPPRGSHYEDIYYARLLQFYEERVLLPRFASAESPYLQLVIGQRKRAIKIYSKWEKKNSLTAFEQQLLLQLRQAEETPLLFQPDCNAVGAILPQANSGAEGKRIFLGVLLCYALFAPIFCGIFLLLSTIFSADTLFYAGCPWYCGFLTAGLPAIFGGIALRRALIPILCPRNKGDALAADRMLNGKKISAFANTVFAIALAAALMFTAFMSCSHVCFYKDRLAFPKSDSFPFTGDRQQAYTDISGLYKIEGRYNDYGDFIPRASYVLYFTDGTHLDLNGFASLEDTEAQILPLLLPYSGPVVILASNGDLPQ